MSPDGHLLVLRTVSVLSILQRRHNGRGGVSNHQHLHCLRNHLFRRRFPTQMASNANMFPFDDVIMMTLSSPCGLVSATDLRKQEKEIYHPPNYDLYIQ